MWSCIRWCLAKRASTRLDEKRKFQGCLFRHSWKKGGYLVTRWDWWVGYLAGSGYLLGWNSPGPAQSIECSAIRAGWHAEESKTEGPVEAQALQTHFHPWCFGEENEHLSKILGDLLHCESCFLQSFTTAGFRLVSWDFRRGIRWRDEWNLTAFFDVSDGCCCCCCCQEVFFSRFGKYFCVMVEGVSFRIAEYSATGAFQAN